ncbi:MAG TPA: hypothetical protein VGX68_29460, partial [Thermoanaerobaculia bacterium]|nr:hypothetical protein [Thermoanaerobaculia bacterium]
MLIRRGDEAWWRSLAPPDVAWPGLGMETLRADPRDYRMEDLPDVRAVLQVGAPESYEIAFTPGQVINQGSRGACVACTDSHIASIYNLFDEGRWIDHDWLKLYTEMGGTGPNGVDVRGTLQKCVDLGCPRLGAGERDKFARYAFAPLLLGQFEETLKAAIAVNRPCQLWLLLPSLFGWESGGSITSGYHSITAVGYRPDAVKILNSWSAQWGRGG